METDDAANADKEKDDQVKEGETNAAVGPSAPEVAATVLESDNAPTVPSDEATPAVEATPPVTDSAQLVPEEVKPESTPTLFEEAPGAVPEIAPVPQEAAPVTPVVPEPVEIAPLAPQAVVVQPEPENTQEPETISPAPENVAEIVSSEEPVALPTNEPEKMDTTPAVEQPAVEAPPAPSATEATVDSAPVAPAPVDAVVAENVETPAPLQATETETQPQA